MTTTFHIRLAVQVLRAGGVIAYPTEGVWGLGCDPQNAHAVQRILKLKQRDPAKGLILVGGELQHFEPYLDHLAAGQVDRLRATWPGPVTWLVPANGVASSWITGRHPGLALRVSAHPQLADLCRAFGGPIVSTSANPSGRPAALSALRVRRYFPEGLDYILNGPLGGRRGPSAIRDLMTDKVLRAG